MSRRFFCSIAAELGKFVSANHTRGKSGVRSGLKLTFDVLQTEFRNPVANAFAALGGFEQVDELRSLSEDCLKYLSFESDRIDLGDYWKIIGFDLTISELSQCRNSKWKFANRSFRLVTSNPNGPIVRGFATNEEHGDLVIHLLLIQLSPEDCVNLARRLLLNSDDLGSANIPGITFYPIAEPGMSFFAPRPWN